LSEILFWEKEEEEKKRRIIINIILFVAYIVYNVVFYIRVVM